MSSFFTAPLSTRKRKFAGHENSTKPSKRRSIDAPRPSYNKGYRTDNGKSRTARPVAAANGDNRSHVQPGRATEASREISADEDSISGSDSDEGEVQPDAADDSDASSDQDETAAERRINLAQRYLDRIKGEVDAAGFDAEDLDKDIIARRLKEDVDEAKGRQFRQIAHLLDFEGADHINFRADTLSTTAVAICADYAYTASKDKTLIKWQLQDPSPSLTTTGKPPPGTKRRPKQLQFVKGVRIRASATQQHGHTGAILSIAASPDGKYVATGGLDKKLIIWRADDLTPLKTFYTHRDAVTALDFAPATSSTTGFGAQLFSASMDRSVKTYSLAGDDSLAYVETLFGHQDHVTAISSMGADQLVSVGARDRSARLWKVVDETQLKFLGDSSRHEEYQTGSIDCVAALPPQHFVTGSDSGALQLWSIHKKKSQFTISLAHGADPVPDLEAVTSESDPKIIEELRKYDKRKPQPRPITALAALPGTDLVFSGSCDGCVRVWKLSDDKRSLTQYALLGAPLGLDSSIHTGTPQVQQGTIAIRGIINSLALMERRKRTVNEFGVSKEGSIQGLAVLAGLGKEMRLGRWSSRKGDRNGTVLFEIPLKSQK